jgi:thiol-disulfide isomerase/thioredoxin
MHDTPNRGARAPRALALAALCAASLLATPAPGTARLPVDSLRAHPELDPDSGVELIGHPAREFRFARWLRSRPLTPESLRGKVVLIRFWTDECRFCRSTLPAIETLRRRYAGRGLVVIGAYHPNEPRPVRDAVVTRWADRLGFGGPIAVDERWDTLNRWWLDGHPDRNWVSVSFLLDREGNVRWVHGGGEYHPSAELRHHSCDVAYAGLEREIESLLE